MSSTVAIAIQSERCWFWSIYSFFPTTIKTSTKQTPTSALLLRNKEDLTRMWLQSFHTKMVTPMREGKVSLFTFVILDVTNDWKSRTIRKLAVLLHNHGELVHYRFHALITRTESNFHIKIKQTIPLFHVVCRFLIMDQRMLLSPCPERLRTDRQGPRKTNHWWFLHCSHYFNAQGSSVHAMETFYGIVCMMPCFMLSFVILRAQDQVKQTFLAFVIITDDRWLLLIFCLFVCLVSFVIFSDKG